MRAFLLAIFSVFLMASLMAKADDCDPISDLSTGFEACPVDFNGIGNGCAPGWFASTGSPSTTNNDGGIVPHGGSRMVVLVTGVNPLQSGCFSEGMFLDVSNLTPGEEYELSVWVRTVSTSPSGNLIFNIDYTSGVAVNNSTSPCLPTTGNSLFSSSSFSASGWTEIVVPFTGQAGLDQIHLHPQPSGFSSAKVFVDDVTISYCSDPCEDVVVDASFRLNVEFLLPNLYKVTPALYDLYDDLDGQHTWVVYRSEQPDGPYTYITTYNSDDFTLFANPGWYYTVLHKVETECGTDCYGWSVCEGCGGNLRANECEYCGPIDCSIIDEPCTVLRPTNLRCSSNPFGGYTLAWNGVPGATYQVEFTPGGRCCTRYKDFRPFVMLTNNNKITPPSHIGSCFSWRVRAVCDKSVSDWSEWKCTNLRSCGLPSRSSDYNSNDLTGAKFKIAEPIGSLSAVPNPTFGGFVEFVFTTIEHGSGALSIYTIDGRQIYASPLTNDQLSVGRYRFDYSELGIKAGTYVARISTVSGLLSARFVVTN